jgi:hypothetical protein
MLSALEIIVDVVDIVDSLCCLEGEPERRTETSLAALQNPTGVSEKVEWPQCMKMLSLW